MNSRHFNFEFCNDGAINDLFPSQILATGPTTVLFDVTIMPLKKFKGFDSSEIALGFITRLRDDQLTVVSLVANKTNKRVLPSLIVFSLIREGLTKLRITKNLCDLLSELKPAFAGGGLFILEVMESHYVCIDSGVVRCFETKESLFESIRLIYPSSNLNRTDYHINQNKF
jgi:hypothetical protein